MPDLTAKRTLVKSPPELWEELSEVEGLMKHLSAFGEIKITKLEPEHTVAWEGEHGSGTVLIEPSGWGTKVTFRAEVPEAAAPEPEPEPEPVVEVTEPEPVRRGFLGWLFRTRNEQPEPVAVAPEPAQVTIETEAIVVEPEPGDGINPEHARAVLDEALDALGAAHHRPFSRG
jgi:hypothetical protein